MINQYVDDGGRFIVLNTLIEDSPMVLVNYYAANKEKDQLKVLKTPSLYGVVTFNFIFDIRLDADRGSPKLKLKSI